MNYWDDYNPGYEDHYEPDYDADCKRAIHWAKTTLDQPFLILDTETTGLDNLAEAVQIAIINQDGAQVFESLIKPTKAIPQDAIKIHGITNEKVENAPTFTDIYLTLKQTLESRPILIYNADFERRILRQQCKLNNLAEINFNASCVMLWYSQYCGDWNVTHQSYTWQKLPNGDHSALGDCRATLAVIKEMAHGK